MYPDDLKYTREHEWARADGNRVRVGITAYAQEALGDIVFVSLPEVGEEVSEGEPCGEVESTKSVSDIYAPVAGTVTARNEVLSSAPELVNSDPYGDGWLVEVTVADPSVLGELLDAAQYRDYVKEQ
ncbi:glycine cleavage system protein H [Frankia sp. CcI49]|uniref:glycine cleavage system protein GcvH n=1 Tax=unclassified Frankia TaxID=2632575 RepID=UPI0006CA3583|nr:MULTISPECIES: glycine cleavage system protein GcvH [unclassified Frankia]KPM56281.1 glycine cleavage system H protein [Frankia sp. R43]ONH58449.1 glycine cleavage system protein H [Frankia sp. CcI49]